MDKSTTLRLLEKSGRKIRQKEETAKITDKEQLVDAYIPLAMGIAYFFSRKYNKDYEEVVAVALFQLTTQINSHAKVNTSFLKKTISNNTLRTLFEDQTIRVPFSSKVRDAPRTASLKDADSKIIEVQASREFVQMVEDADFTDQERHILEVRKKHSSIPSALKELGFSHSYMCRKLKEMKRKMV